MKKILVVDDEPLAVKAIIKKLKEENFATDCAYDGEEALLKIREEKPDLILLDIVMPKLDGISVIKKLKESNETRDIPVIILSNLLYDDDRIQDLIRTGSTNYLIKVDHSLNDVVNHIKQKLLL